MCLNDLRHKWLAGWRATLLLVPKAWNTKDAGQVTYASIAVEQRGKFALKHPKLFQFHAINPPVSVVFPRTAFDDDVRLKLQAFTGPMGPLSRSTNTARRSDIFGGRWRQRAFH